MKEETGATYKPATNSIKALVVSDAKDGKTSTLVSQLLGVYPGQKQGGVISHPNNLHVLCTDTASLDKLSDFLVKACGASEEALQYKVYNMEEDYQKAFTNSFDYAASFYNTLTATIAKIRERIASKPNEVSAVLFSSVTTISRAILRSIRGAPREAKGGATLVPSTMSIPKWSMLADQLNDLQAAGQGIPAHIFWEGHLGERIDGEEKDDQGKATRYDTIQVPGSVGQSWAANVSHALVLRRQKGIVHSGTKVDKVDFDTQPNLKMFGIGRGATTHLLKYEPDLTVMLSKLGFKVGNWGKEEDDGE